MDSEARVLVVEDEDGIREVVVDLLTHHGYAVTAASAAREALQAMEEQRFDIVVTDLLMPDGSGEQVINAATAEGARVIVITGTGGDRLHEDVEQLGASACLRKPFQLSEFMEAVRRLAPGAAA